jgi:putative ABC transport system permease protein
MKGSVTMSLAWSNLLHHKARTAAAVTGVAFALTLVFLQLGFFAAVRSTATLLYDRLDFDLLLVSRNYVNVNYPGTFPRERLVQAAGLAGVERAAPLYVGVHLWRNPLKGPGAAGPRPAWDLREDPARRTARLRRNIMVVGFRLSDRVFTGVPEMDRARAALAVPDALLIDTCTRREFGPQDTGVETELGPHRVRLAGRFTIGTGLGADGLVIASDETCCRVLGRPLRVVSLGLVKLRPGVDAATAAAELNRSLPPDVRARTRGEVVAREQRFCLRVTPAGVILSLGLLVAVTVGMVFAYQVIASDVQDHLRQYATLKAMGYRNGYLARVVLLQAAIIALAGYLPAVLAARGLYAWTHRLNGIAIALAPARSAVVLVLALALCSLSGLLALRRAIKTDPADLF